jgi:hypothetical protein
VIASVVGFFVNARVGMFIALVLILVPIISTIWVYIAAVKCDATMTVNTGIIKKGQSITLHIKVKNRSFLSSGPVFIRLKWSAHLIGDEDNSRVVYVMPRSTTEFCMELTGKICGLANYGIDLIEIRNHMGIKLLEQHPYEEHSSIVAIMPEVVESDEYTSLIQRVINSVNTSDDSEDTVEGVGNVFSGFPGYENREYVPGDPLKRINWKQSAKRGHLLVRKEDEAELSTVYMCLDRCFSLLSDTEEATLCMQSCVEGSISIALSLVKSGCHVVYKCWLGEWITVEINTESGFNELIRRLAVYTFSSSVDGEERFPAEVFDSAKAKNVLICTPFWDSPLKNNDITVYSVVAYGSEEYNHLSEYLGEVDGNEHV